MKLPLHYLKLCVRCCMKNDIIEASRVVIQNLVIGEKSNKEILKVWDEIRGSDKFENYVKKSKVLELIKE